MESVEFCSHPALHRSSTRVLAGGGKEVAAAVIHSGDRRGLTLPSYGLVASKGVMGRNLTGEYFCTNSPDFIITSDKGQLSSEAMLLHHNHQKGPVSLPEVPVKGPTF